MLSRSRRSPSKFVVHGKLKDSQNFTSFVATKRSLQTIFYGWGSTASRPLRQFTCITKFSEIPGTHFIDLRRMKAELTLVLNERPLDCGSSALTTGPLFIVILFAINTFTQQQHTVLSFLKICFIENCLSQSCLSEKNHHSLMAFIKVK